VYELNTIPTGIPAKGAWRDVTRSRVTANVWYLGATSLLTDISSEMITSILPVYLFLQLGMTPLAFGGVDGIYQGAAALVRTASGFSADRWRRHKFIAALGYGFSALSKLGLLLAGTAWLPIAAVLAVDRLGKGIRTSPRDALIAQSAQREHLGTAFGVHRALDAGGAMLGPIVAFSLMAIVPGRFDLVFLTSFWIAIVGLAVLLLFVHSAARTVPNDRNRVGITTAIELLRVPHFRPILAAAAVLALGTVSDAFLYLTLQHTVGLDRTLLPLLYVGTPFCYFLLAGPMGILADRFGRGLTFIMGHALLLILYAVLLVPRLAGLGPVVCVALLGGYYATTDGVLAALGSAALPAEVRGTGLALLATGTSLGRVFASVVFGLVWTEWGTRAALIFFAVALGAGMLVAFKQLATPRHET
jgi:MFS family permease